jgi:site-specific DNA recombinase
MREKSTEQNGVGDEAKSVTRQIEHARAYAAKKGWTIDERHIYVDDGISGAESSNRPSFVRLMNALRPRAPFETSIVSELSRLGREQLETGYAVKQVSQAGVQIVSYLEDKAILLDTPTDKFLMSAVNFVDEMERERIRQRVTDALDRKAVKGYVTGGACFGYTNVEVFGLGGKRAHVVRDVREAEAAVVRRIFALCAAGKGVKTIAKTLNAESAPAPSPRHDRPRSWTPSSVHAVLHRRAYVGEVVYHMTRRRDRWGQRTFQRRPESEWLTIAEPTRRIVSDEAWEAAYHRLAASAATYLRRVWGRPPTGIESKYLLSGLSRCGLCGGSMIAHNSTHGRAPLCYYVCSTYTNRGRTACSNRLHLPMQPADFAVLNKFADYVLDPDVVEGAIADSLEELRPSAEATVATRAALETELRRVESQQQRYADAIATAGDVDVLVKALQDRQHHRVRLQREIEAIGGARPVSPFDIQRIEKDLRCQLKDWRALLRREAPIARQMLMKLIDARLTFTPDFEAKSYAFTGTATFDKLLEGLISPKDGEALPWVWCARRDSNPRPTGSKPAALSN